MIPLLKEWPAGEPVPAISLQQPWAASVLWLNKDVENRSRWPFKHRGLILIHASKGSIYREDVEAAIEKARLAERVEPQLVLDIEVALVEPEPRAKRTVEGDLGVFVNAHNIVEMIGDPAWEARLADLQALPPDSIYKLVAPFLPAPLVDKASSLGLSHWVVQDGQAFVIYFSRP